MTKKILDADTTTWNEEEKKNIEPHLRKYKYKIDFQLPNGKIRYAYTNNEPELISSYMKHINAKILKVTEL